MFSNNRKTIGLFIGRMVNYFQKVMCESIIDTARDLGYNLAVLSVFGEFGDNFGFAIGEKEIINLPNYDKFDAMIIAPDTLDISGMDEDVIQIMKEKANYPVVSIRKEVEGFYNVLTDDDTVMEGVIRHFIVEHGFKKLCFMSGPEGFVDGDRRLGCFLRLMEEYGLPVEENQVFHGNFWRGKAGEACDHFLKKGMYMPEAIICANDYMAIDICNELSNRNIRIPQDVCVSGYDGIRETDLYIPTITTVEVPFGEMGRKSVEIIHDVLSGKKRDKKTYMSTKDRYKESCGCKQFDMVRQSRDQKDFFERLEAINRDGMQSSFMSIDLGGIADYERLSDTISRYIAFNDGYENFYLFMCDDEGMSGGSNPVYKTFTPKMRMKMGIQEGKVIGEATYAFAKEELLPAELAREEPMVYFFLPLHFNESFFGYTAISFYGGGCYNEFYEPFMVNVANALESIRIQEKMQHLIWELEEMNVKDFLTGLLNRRGFEKFTGMFLNQAKEEGLRIFILGLDLDDMKGINDKNGHEEGDNALKVVAAGLKNAAVYGEICARVGGDEFNVIGLNYSEEMAKGFIDRFLGYLKTYNETEGKPYRIAASYGMYVSKAGERQSLQELMRISDDKMYSQKRSKRGGC